MRLAIPLTPVYYFEVTPRSERLLYHLPYPRLAVLVRRKIVRREALRDFPDALEVEVSDEEYRLVREEYGFRPPLTPRLVWVAFRGLLVHSHDEPSIRGIINA